MATITNQFEFEQKLDAQIKAAEKLRDSFAGRLSTKNPLSDAYNNILAKLREMNMQDPRKGEANPKEYIRVASSAPLDARQAIAFKGPSEGVAKSILKYLPSLGLSREDSLASAILCVIEDYERSFPCLSDAKLSLEDQLLVTLAALENHPVLNFEEYKTQEVMYQTANSEDEREMQEIQRRFEQVRGRKTQFIRKHILNYLPAEIKAQPSYRKVLLQASIRRDAFGTLEALRESASQEEALKSTSANLLDGLSVEEKLDLLEAAAKYGVGLASCNLDLFAIPPDTEWYPRLQGIFKKDVTAGQSLFGAYALEGVHHYPFNLGRLEPILPRRITNTEAQEYLKRAEAAAEGGKPRTYTPSEIDEVRTSLQEKDIGRFLESLKWGIARNWKDYVQDRKLGIVFGDPSLKVRDILFLVAYSVFEEEQVFENIFEMIQKNHPQQSDDAAKLNLLANRYYFFTVVGLNVSMLFTRSKKPSGSFGTLIEEISDYQISSMLHSCMSIFIKIGDVMFKDMSIAWNMLIGQCEGKIDTVFHEMNQLFDILDMLLTILEPVMPDMSNWMHTLIDALSQDAPDLPLESLDSPKQPQLRVTTRTMITRSRDLLYRYCLDALYFNAKTGGVTPINVIQTLKIPRSKTDKLRTMLSNDPNKAKR